MLSCELLGTLPQISSAKLGESLHLSLDICLYCSSRLLGPESASYWVGRDSPSLSGCFDHYWNLDISPQLLVSLQHVVNEGTIQKRGAICHNDDYINTYFIGHYF